MAGQEPADRPAGPSRTGTTAPGAASPAEPSGARAAVRDSAERVSTRRIPPPLGRTVRTHGTFTWRGPAASVTFVPVRPAAPVAPAPPAVTPPAPPRGEPRGRGAAATTPAAIPTVSPLRREEPPRTAADRSPARPPRRGAASRSAGPVGPTASGTPEVGLSAGRTDGPRGARPAPRTPVGRTSRGEGTATPGRRRATPLGLSGRGPVASRRRTTLSGPPRPAPAAGPEPGTRAAQPATTGPVPAGGPEDGPRAAGEPPAPPVRPEHGRGAGGESQRAEHGDTARPRPPRAATDPAADRGAGDRGTRRDAGPGRTLRRRSRRERRADSRDAVRAAAEAETRGDSPSSPDSAAQPAAGAPRPPRRTRRALRRSGAPGPAADAPAEPSPNLRQAPKEAEDTARRRGNRLLRGVRGGQDARRPGAAPDPARERGTAPYPPGSAAAVPAVDRTPDDRPAGPRAVAESAPERAGTPRTTAPTAIAPPEPKRKRRTPFTTASRLFGRPSAERAAGDTPEGDEAASPPVTDRPAAQPTAPDCGAGTGAVGAGPTGRRAAAAAAGGTGRGAGPTAAESTTTAAPSVDAAAPAPVDPDRESAEHPSERRQQRKRGRRRSQHASAGRGGDRRGATAHPVPTASASGDAGRREPVGGLLPDDPSDTGTGADAHPDAHPDAHADEHAAPDVAVTPVHAFDALYLRNAGPIGQQAYLLCGRRDTAARAVAHGFRLAWERWPQVAVDRDPAGWVRAAAYEYALSPWHRFRPWARTPLALGAGREEQELLDALLGLPAGQRRAVVLRDALGLGPAEAAAEAECTTAAAEARVRRGRDALAVALPRLAVVEPERRGEVLGAMMEALTASQPVPPLPASRARLECERTSRRQVQAAVALVVVTVGATAAGLFTG